MDHKEHNEQRDDLREPRVLRKMAFNDDGTMSGETVNNKVWVVVGV